MLWLLSMDYRIAFDERNHESTSTEWRTAPELGVSVEKKTEPPQLCAGAIDQNIRGRDAGQLLDTTKVARAG